MKNFKITHCGKDYFVKAKDSNEAVNKVKTHKIADKAINRKDLKPGMHIIWRDYMGSHEGIIKDINQAGSYTAVNATVKDSTTIRDAKCMTSSEHILWRQAEFDDFCNKFGYRYDAMQRYGPFYGYISIEHPTLGNFRVSGHKGDVRTDGKPWKSIKPLNSQQTKWVNEHMKELAQLFKRCGSMDIADSSINDADEYIIFTENGVIKGTLASNYNSRIRNANQVTNFSKQGFKSTQQAKEYMEKYGNGAKVIIKDNTPDRDKVEIKDSPIKDANGIKILGTRNYNGNWIKVVYPNSDDIGVVIDLQNKLKRKVEHSGLTDILLIEGTSSDIPKIKSALGIK